MNEHINAEKKGMSSVSGSWQPCKYGLQPGVCLQSMAGSDLGSLCPCPIHSLLSLLFAAPQWVRSALCSCLWFSCYTCTDSVKGIVSPRLCVPWGIKLSRDCSREPARSAGITGMQSGAQCPGLDALLGAGQAAAVSGRLRSGSGPGSVPVPRGGQRNPAAPEQRDWKGRGRGKGPAVPGSYWRDILLMWGSYYVTWADLSRYPEGNFILQPATQLCSGERLRAVSPLSNLIQASLNALQSEVKLEYQSAYMAF